MYHCIMKSQLHKSPNFTSRYNTTGGGGGGWGGGWDKYVAKWGGVQIRLRYQHMTGGSE
jgi:hypothetical protein